MRVLLRNVVGECLELDVEQGSPATQLTKMVMQHWKVPAECQKLLIGTRALENGASLECPSEDGCDVSVEVTLVVSLDKVCRDVLSSSRTVQISALRALGALEERGGPAALAAVTSCLWAPRVAVRCEAIEALAKVAKRGDQAAVTSLGSCLADLDHGTRCTAQQAMLQVAVPGDEFAMAAICSHLQHPGADVRRSLLESLAMLTVGSEHAAAAASAVAKRLDECRPQQRTAAVDALMELCTVADSKTLVASTESLVNVDLASRRAVVAALADVTERGAEHVAHCVASVVRSILQVEHVGDDDPITAVSGRLEDVHAGVRRAAARTLLLVAGSTWEEGSVDVLLRRLDDPWEVVRGTSLLAQAVVSHCEGSASGMQDGPGGGALRKLAAQALTRLAGPPPPP